MIITVDKKQLVNQRRKSTHPLSWERMQLLEINPQYVRLSAIKRVICHKVIKYCIKHFLTRLGCGSLRESPADNIVVCFAGASNWKRKLPP